MCETRKMQSVSAIKTIRIICMLFVLRQIKCDVVEMEGASNDKQILYVTDCTANCMQRNLTAVLFGCYESCIDTNHTQELKRYNDEGDEIRIICREDDSIVIKVENSMLNNDEESQVNEKMSKGFTYLLQIQRNSSDDPLQWFYLSDSPIVKIPNLQKNTSYIVIANIFSGNFKYQQLTLAKSFRTLENEFLVPKSISNDTIELNYVLKNSSEMLSAKLSWDQTDDKSCNYDIHMYDPHEENDLIEPNFRKLSPIELDVLQMDSLKFETEYIVEIHGVNGKHPYIDGNKSVFEFTTPSCSLFHGFDLQKCPPEPLLNINSTCRGNRLDSYRINVTWDLPRAIPDYYEVSINLFTNKANILSQNVSGSKTYAFFPEVNTTDAKYDVQIIAFSQGGYTASPVIEFSINRQELFKEQSYLIFVCVLFSIAILLSIFLAYQIRRNRLRHKKEIYSKDIHLQKLIQLINEDEDEMEVKPTDVELFEEIGKGAFGIVRRGTLNSKRAIAVKMLKEDASREDIEAFLIEIRLMKSVGHHENIVGIVGHSTKLRNKMMLLTEYCSNGNLLEYLRKFSRKIQHFESKPQNIVFNPLYDDNPSNSCNISYENESVKVTRVAKIPKASFAENRAYGLLLPTENDPKLFNKNNNIVKSASDIPQITGRDLMKFAKQIATGMDFLANKKIVHRDLAARNVLVCADKTVKIADFGLSRDINEDDVYMKTSAGRLPIKWLALESMTDQKYTSQSDVWSYGILLYEIVTFGATPYNSESVTVDCLIDYLKSGKRMKRPDRCSHEIYDLMSSCWRADPSKRPTFAEISVKIDQLIREEVITVRQVEGLESSTRFRSDEPNSDEHALDNGYMEPY